MPGRTPQEAYDAFIEPFRQAASLLDTYTQFVTNRKGGFKKGDKYAWLLNGGSGAKLPGFGTLYASMEFKIIDADPEKHEARYRVTTCGYNYKLAAEDGIDRVRAHWHPEGASDVKGPHLHLPPDFSEHLTSPRITFENVVQWCAEFGARLTCAKEEVEQRLALTEVNHRLYRSWNTDPNEPRG